MIENKFGRWNENWDLINRGLNICYKRTTSSFDVIRHARIICNTKSLFMELHKCLGIMQIFQNLLNISEMKKFDFVTFFQKSINKNF